MTALEDTQQRLTAAWKIHTRAYEEATNAGAELARLLLIKAGEDEQADPRVAGLRFTTEYCYDDEGGYFDSLSVALLDEEESDIDYDGEFESIGPEAIRRLCGVAEGADSGQITVAEAQERSF